MTYDHTAIEAKWQERWAQSKLYETQDHDGDTENRFVLVEFPYPSGNLHIGHWHAFAVPDIYARYLRMRGYNVLFPIGFDSFGLPAENAAIKRGLDPRAWTYDNIDHMSRQIRSMGNMFDWSRKVVTSDPEYYRWTQWLFLALYEKNLAYKKKSSVPWCNSCKTVLANEQIVSGACERCDTEVTQRDLEQWFFKITAYAERLLNDLDSLDWPEEIKQAQREWIGKSEGALLQFNIKRSQEEHTSIEVFTTRPDTLYGATYVVLAPEHTLVTDLKQSIENWDEVAHYIAQTKAKKELERKEAKVKTGVALRGITAVNPATKEEIPIWIADYVLASYGTGAIMAVPAHDDRDLQFAQKYGLEVRPVIAQIDSTVGIVPGLSEGKMQSMQESGFAHVGGGLLINSGPFDRLPSEDAKQKITEHVGGSLTHQYRLRDWLLSRQRYWGCPIPIVYDPEGKPHPVPAEHLPWTLPEDVDFTPTGEAPLARSHELKERTERIFGKGWTPEVDTMDTFVDSSWYFLRYLDPHNAEVFSSPEKQKQWMPVDRYSGGAEHTTMHLLYSRFFYKALYDLGLVTHAEPYQRRMNRGLILGPDGRKMSKSKGNVIDPDDFVAKVGADSVKTYLAFIGPYNEVGQYPWDLGGIAGIRRFLERVWGMQKKIRSEHGNGDGAVEILLHQTIKKVGNDIAHFKFNTAISQLMILVNALEKPSGVSSYTYETLVRLLAPFAPHLTEELWEVLGHQTSIHLEPWPTYDAVLLSSANVTIAIQVNGKVRGTFSASPEVTEQEALTLAETHVSVKKYLEGATIVRKIFVPGRLVNLVVNQAPSP